LAAFPVGFSRALEVARVGVLGPTRTVKAMFVGGRGFSLSGHRGAFKKLGGPLRQILLQGLVAAA
jgi:hypothetical protein